MAARAQRTPLAFGAQEWALPDTSLKLAWSGPGSGLYLAAGGTHSRVRHPSANRAYATVREADRAVQAFVSAGTEEE